MLTRFLRNKCTAHVFLNGFRAQFLVLNFQNGFWIPSGNGLINHFLFARICIVNIIYEHCVIIHSYSNILLASYSHQMRSTSCTLLLIGITVVGFFKTYTYRFGKQKCNIIIIYRMFTRNNNDNCCSPSMCSILIRYVRF